MEVAKEDDAKPASKDEIHRLMGACLDAWSFMEFHLSTLFSAINLRKIGKGTGLHHAYDQITSFDTRLRFLDSCIRCGDHEKEVKDRWALLSKEIKASTPARADIAHGTVVDGMPKGYFLQPLFKLSMFDDEYGKKKEQLWREDLLETLQVFERLQGRVWDFNFYFGLINETVQGDVASLGDPIKYTLPPEDR